MVRFIEREASNYKFMKWTFIIFQKLKAAIALGVVFLIVFATNLLDKNNFTKLQHSFTSVYDDRLMAEVYIYKFSNQLHQKKLLFAEGDDYQTTELATLESANKSLNDSIRMLVNKYELTKLTPEEAKYFTRFKGQIEQLFSMESQMLSSNIITHESLTRLHQKLSHSLDELTQIQQQEGKNLIEASNRIFAASKLTFRLEIAILIVIALIVQVLIFSARSTMPKVEQNSMLN